MAFVTGTPIAAAVVREVAELRRAREEATELAVALHGGPRPAHGSAALPAVPGGGSSPRRKAEAMSSSAGGGGGQSLSARGPSPRRRATQEAAAHAFKAASLQGSTSKQVGLEVERLQPANLEPAPAARLGFTHEGPQPQQSPHVALHASDAVHAHIPAPLGYDSWANRSTQRGGPAAESIVGGHEAVVLAEVETIAAEVGLTPEAMADAGLSVDEARSLFERLYVHTTGFVQQLAEAFGGQPHRMALLGTVWTAFGTLVERVKMDGVDYHSALAAHHRRAEAAYAQLDSDFRATSEYLQAQIEEAKAQTAARVAEREEQSARAEAAEALAAKTSEERVAAEATLRVVEKEVKAEVQKRESVERRLVEETNALAPLKAQVGQLAAAKAEAAQSKKVAEKNGAELGAQLEANKRLNTYVQQAEVTNQLLREEKEELEKEVSHVSLALDAKVREVERVVTELQTEQEKVVELRQEKEHVEASAKEKVGQLRQQVAEAEKATQKEKARAVAAERQVEAVREEVEHVQQETGNVEEEKVLMQAELDHERTLLRDERAKVDDLTRALEAERQATAKAKQATEAALQEAAGARTQAKKTIDEVAKARQDAKEAREALDALKLTAFRETDQLKAELAVAVADKEAAEAEVAEAREGVKAAKERVKTLEEESQKARIVAAERELAHQTHLANQEEAQKLEREAAAAHQATELQHALEEAATLREALEATSSLFESFEVMRGEVARLTADTECYAAERRQFEEALGCRFELRSTCAVVETVSFVLDDPMREELTAQLALQCEQQRALDATERDLAEVLGRLASLEAFCAAELQPEVESASEALHELPRLREDLVQAGLLRAEGLSQLQRVRDEADAERQRHLNEISAANMKVAQVSEQAAFTTELQASQLAQVTKELAEANEELQNWRTGNIRLANARQWREERNKAKGECSSAEGAPSGSAVSSRGATPATPDSGSGLLRPGRRGGPGGAGLDALPE